MKITKPLLPSRKSPLVRAVASALLISERITKGKATKKPSMGVKRDQKAQRFQIHQYQIVEDGLRRIHRDQSKRWLQVARGVRAAWIMAQIQKIAKATIEIPKTI